MTEQKTQEETKQEENINPTQDSLAETMGRSLNTKDNALAAAVSGTSNKAATKKEDPNQISISLDKFETKLGNKRI